MERAGLALADAVEAAMDRLHIPEALFVCGGGNNGGNRGSYQQTSRPAPSSAIGDGFMNIPDGVEDEGLPFN